MYIDEKLQQYGSGLEHERPKATNLVVVFWARSLSFGLLFGLDLLYQVQNFDHLLQFYYLPSFIIPYPPYLWFWQNYPSPNLLDPSTITIRRLYIFFSHIPFNAEEWQDFTTKSFNNFLYLCMMLGPNLDWTYLVPFEFGSVCPSVPVHLSIWMYARGTSILPLSIIGSFSFWTCDSSCHDS